MFEICALRSQQSIFWQAIPCFLLYFSGANPSWEEDSAGLQPSLVKGSNPFWVPQDRIWRWLQLQSTNYSHNQLMHGCNQSWLIAAWEMKCQLQLPEKDSQTFFCAYTFPPVCILLWNVLVPLQHIQQLKKLIHRHTEVPVELVWVHLQFLYLAVKLSTA